VDGDASEIEGAELPVSATCLAPLDQEAAGGREALDPVVLTVDDVDGAVRAAAWAAPANVSGKLVPTAM
jgi:hypothetical protein